MGKYIPFLLLVLGLLLAWGAYINNSWELTIAAGASFGSIIKYYL